jgi:DNA-binding beta-propeller fold protein YncE
MTRVVVIVLLLFGSSRLLAQDKTPQERVPAQQPAPAEIPRIPFQSVSLLKTTPPLYLGEVPAVAVDSKGNIYVANRGAHPLVEFDKEGKYIREIGEGDLNLPDTNNLSHAVRIDSDDNIWFVDAGALLVTKYDQSGRVLLNVGRRKSPPEYTARKTDSGETSRADRAERNPTDKMETFDRPTDVTFGANGDFFVADGYGSMRIMKFHKNGNWVKTWGGPGTGPGQFEVSHTLAVDAKGLLYVTDRENKRIQIFDQDGNYLREWNHIGGGTGAYPWSLCFTDAPNQVAYFSDGYKGHIWKLDLDGKVLGVLGEFGREIGQFNHAHGIACGNGPANVIYVAETRTRRVQKLTVGEVAKHSSASR